MKLFARTVLPFLAVIALIDLTATVGRHNSASLTVATCLLLVLPGFLFIRLLGRQTYLAWTTALYSIACSLLYLMVAGCLASLVGGITLRNVLIIITVSLASMAVATIRNTKDFFIREGSNSYEKVIRAIFLTLFLLTIVGSNVLNTGGSGSLSLAVLIALPTVILIVAVLVRRAVVSSRIVPWLIYFTAAICLLALSLRSGYLIGWDINQEFRVFQATVSAGMWHPGTTDPYAACLSITVLPAVLHLFVPFSDLYIFKFLYPLIAALIPVVLYYTYLQVCGRRLWFALGATFVFLIQAQFMGELAGIARQEIGFLFFAMLLLTLVELRSTSRERLVFTVLFGAGMIVSHYSSSYVALCVLSVAYVVVRIVGSSTKRLRTSEARMKEPLIGGFALLAIIVLAVVWYGGVTRIGGEIPRVVDEVYVGAGQAFSSALHSNTVNAALTLSNGDPSKAVSSFGASISRQGPTYASTDRILYVSPQSSAPLISNSVLSDYFAYFLPIVFRFALIIGIVTVTVLSYRQKIPLSLWALGVVSTISLGAIIVLPQLSILYNLERLYQQILMILAPVIVLGFCYMFRLLRLGRVLAPCICLLCVTYFLSTSGLAGRALSGSDFVTFSNKGDAYERYFPTSGEIHGLKWLAAQDVSAQDINIDLYAGLRASAYTDINRFSVNGLLIPTSIKPESYVFASNTNKTYGRTFYFNVNQVLTFNYPTYYIADHLDLVYNSGSCAVFR